jgi:hypothetical protein
MKMLSVAILAQGLLVLDIVINTVKDTGWRLLIVQKMMQHVKCMGVTAMDNIEILYIQPYNIFPSLEGNPIGFRERIM